MLPPLTRADLLHRLDAGEPILLPTPRAAAQLRAAFDAHQRVAGIPAWEPAPVLAWSQWTQSLWSGLIVEGHEPRLLLNPAQEHALWREIVAGTASIALGSPDALAALASSAWQLAAQFQALHRLRATANTHDSRIFADWADAFARRCIQRNYVSAAQLELSLQQHVEMGTLTPPKTLTLAGFLDRTPAQQALLDTLAARGTRLRDHTLAASPTENPGAPHLDPEMRASTAARTTLPTERDELTFAARWAHTHLASNPTASLAILVPDLPKIRAELEQTLLETLTPELQSIHADLAAAPWQFSNGLALANLPILADALRLAHWAAHALPTDAVSALLLSPYLAQTAAEPHRSAAARFDATILRQTPMLRDEIRLPWLLQLAQHTQARTGEPEPSILAALRDLHTTLQRNDLHRPRTWADWTEFLRDLTRSVAWPGTRTLNATEFEATRAWDSLLDTLATLDFTGRRIPYTTFLTELDRQSTTTLFQPPACTGEKSGAPYLASEMWACTEAGAPYLASEMWAATTPHTPATPIQILTPTDSLACLFDTVLHLRATDANIPATEHIHPLLAWPLQRSLNMPGADPTQTATRARTFLADLQQRTAGILFTHAAEDADGKLRPSSLLAAVPEVAAEDLAPSPAPTKPISLEAFEDTSTLPPLLAANIPGGATVLKLQAACGFLAFAQLRLRATELTTPELGLDARESGNLLHRTLQNFWARVKTQAELRALSTEARTALLRESIDAALPHRLRPETAWDDAYLALQRDRMLALLPHWLEAELTRGPFEVRAIETDQQIPVGPLTLDLRLDRLDLVPGADGQPGGFVLVDYKTGLAGKPADWLTERPTDPQLPLYALLHQSEPGELKGLAFAKVRAGKDMKWHGYQAEAGILPTSTANPLVELSYQLDEWHHTLTHLAEDFAAGDARVRPRDFRIDCARCAQRLLCRVDFAALDQPHPGDDPETGEQEPI